MLARPASGGAPGIPRIGPRKRRSLDRLASVGRPWLGRTETQCAFPVAGDGGHLLNCASPGRAPRRGWAAYCDAHTRIMFQPDPGPVSE